MLILIVVIIEDAAEGDEGTCGAEGGAECRGGAVKNKEHQHATRNMPNKQTIAYTYMHVYIYI